MDRKEVLKYFHEQKDYMEKRVAEGIEKYRKGDIKITFTQDGKHIFPKKVSINQTSHEFNFGANIFMLDTLKDYQNEPFEEGLFKEGYDVSELADYKERNAKYKEIFKDMCNFATVPFYWNALEPEQNKPRYIKNEPHIHRRPTPASCVEFCKENGIRMKCHCLNYNGCEPKWVQAMTDPEDVKCALEKRFRECAELFADDIDGWEVTNETLVLYPQPGGTSCFFPDKDFVNWSFKTARKHFKNNELIINDNHETVYEQFIGRRSAYYMQIERELAKGAEIDSIGLQFHIFYKREKELEMAKKFYNPEFLYAVLDTYSEFNLPLQITEITIPAYSDSPEDEAIQAEIMKNLYSIWFSVPQMEAIIYWNLVEGYLGPVADMDSGENYYRGGFCRYDFSKKPVYDVIHNLINKEWHTSAEFKNVSDSVDFRGFYGDYDVTFEIGGKVYTKKISASKNSNNTFEIQL